MRPQSEKYSFAELLNIMTILREKCPWDQEQTLDSLRPFLIEEAYEALEASEQGDHKALTEELGDVLLQIVFQAQIGTEFTGHKHFNIHDVIHAISQKMVARHPHVFGEAEVSDSDAVLKQWGEIKAGERKKSGQETFQGIPQHLPSLMRAQRMGEKVARVGFDWPDLHGPLNKLHEELGELKEVLNAPVPNLEHLKDELGDVLFSVVNLCRKLGTDAETTLRDSCNKFQRRWETVEKIALSQNRSLEDMSLSEQEALWVQAKKELLAKSQ